jgi:hypothetical protein
MAKESRTARLRLVVAALFAVLWTLTVWSSGRTSGLEAAPTLAVLPAAASRGVRRPASRSWASSSDSVCRGNGLAGATYVSRLAAGRGLTVSSPLPLAQGRPALHASAEWSAGHR